MSSQGADSTQEIFDSIVKKRGIKNVDDFINPKYEQLHDPRKLPDIKKAIERIKVAKEKNETVAIYGDYDIDGLTATTLLIEAFSRLGIEATYYLPDRFAEGYGMSTSGIDVIKTTGASLIITVDCGSRSIDEIKYANKLGIDVVVTDHHEVGDTLPDAVAVVNPKRPDSKYAWRDLAGVGVAFKLIQALQLEDRFSKQLPQGQEKWLLDLVALGTVCDVVNLLDENRTLVWWGLKVMQKTKWPGLKALAYVSNVDLEEVSAEDLGYRFGPRLNASGRLEHAELSLKLLTAKTGKEALKIADELNKLNQKRQTDQRRIAKEAKELAEDFVDDNVLVLAKEDWSHGINGIVASSVSQSQAKPTFILQIMDDETKGSARSFGDFHLADAIKQVDDLAISGGGHKLAAGITIKTKDLDELRKRLNEHYESLKLKEQEKYLLPSPVADVAALDTLSLDLISKLELLAPFGNGNEQPIFTSKGVTLDNWKPVGSDLSHAKSTFSDKNGYRLDAIGFGLAEKMPEPNQAVDITYYPQKNTFNGRTTVQMQILTIGVA